MEDLCRFCDVRYECDIQKALEEHTSLSRDDLMFMCQSARCYVSKGSTKSDVVKAIIDVMCTNESVGQIILGDMQRHVSDVNDMKDLIHLSDEEIRTELKRARRKIDLLWRIKHAREEALEEKEKETREDYDAEDQMVDAEYENGVFPWCTGIPLRTYVKTEFLKIQKERDRGRGKHRCDDEIYKVACERYIMYAKEDADTSGVVNVDTSNFVFDTFNEFIAKL